MRSPSQTLLERRRRDGDLVVCPMHELPTPLPGTHLDRIHAFSFETAPDRCASSACSQRFSVTVRSSHDSRASTTNKDESPSHCVGSPYFPLTRCGGFASRYFAFSLALLRVLHFPHA